LTHKISQPYLLLEVCTHLQCRIKRTSNSLVLLSYNHFITYQRIKCHSKILDIWSSIQNWTWNMNVLEISIPHPDWCLVSINSSRSSALQPHTLDIQVPNRAWVLGMAPVHCDGRLRSAVEDRRWVMTCPG